MENEREGWSLSKILVKAKPFIGVLSLQFGSAGMTIIAMIALNQGMNHFVMAVYRYIVATVVMAPFALVLERKIRPKMTYTTFIKILALGLLEPVIDQNLYYAGMKYTSTSFASAMCNITPVLTFLMAVILRLERVELKKVHSLAKVVGTVITMGGAMVMTLFSGPVLEIVWFNRRGGETTHSRGTHDSGDIAKDWVKGSLMLIIGCVCWAGFIILQGLTLRDYPAGLSLSTLTCLAGAVEGAVVTLAIERGNTAVWSLGWDIKLLSCVYAGVVCSGIAYYVQGVVIKLRGPVFVTAFTPLRLVIVVILGSFCLAEKLYLGSVIGSAIIIPGLYFVVWGKSKDQIVSPPASEDMSDLPTKFKIVDKAIIIDFSNIDPEKCPATFSSPKALH